nr:unnamed protein product [Spirometra erinaceieuropaei]
MDAATLNQRLLEQFIAGVRDPEIRKALMRTQSATFDEALDLARLEEALQAVCDQPSQPLLGIVAVQSQTARDCATQTPWHPCSCGSYYFRQNQWRRQPPRRGAGPQTRHSVQAIDASTEEHSDGPTFAAHFNKLKPYALDDSSCCPVSSELPSFPSAELPHPPTDPSSIISVPSSPPAPAVPTSPAHPSPLPPLVSRTVEVPPEGGFGIPLDGLIPDGTSVLQEGAV